jgi:3-oxoacyl-[acyl-carrier protein] reductase
MSEQANIVILTGAGKGIGRATALRLASAGFQVIAVDIDAGSLATLADKCKDLSGTVVPVKADVRSRAAVEAAVKEAMDRFGRIDVVINNAGIEIVKPIQDITDEDYAATLDINLRSVFLFVRAVVPIMQKQRSGLIVNTSSTAGLRGIRDDAVYCASKFGVIGMSEALDEELRQYGVRVTYICPGNTNTDLPLSWSPADDPYRRYFLRPEDIAEAIYYVVSQPQNVAIGQLVVRPIIQPPYSGMLPLPK